MGRCGGSDRNCKLLSCYAHGCQRLTSLGTITWTVRDSVYSASSRARKIDGISDHQSGFEFTEFSMHFIPVTVNRRLTHATQANRAGVILFFLTLYTSKAAGVALLYRFTLLRRHKLTIYISIAFLLLLGIVSILLLNIDCGLTGTLYWHISRHPSQCTSQVGHLLPRPDQDKTLTLSSTRAGKSLPPSTSPPRSSFSSCQLT